MGARSETSALARLLAVASILCGVLATSPREGCLAPGEERGHQFASFGVPGGYCLRDLAPDAGYELRLSWRPVPVPVEFTIEVAAGDAPRGFLPGRVTPPAADEAGDVAVAASAPLSVTGSEALRLHTESAGRVLLPAVSKAGAWVGVPVERVHVRVAAAPASVPRPGGAAPVGGVAYSVRLDPLLHAHLAPLPTRAAGPTLVVLLAAALLTVAAVRWLLRAQASPIAAPPAQGADDVADERLRRRALPRGRLPAGDEAPLAAPASPGPAVRRRVTRGGSRSPAASSSARRKRA